MSRCLYQRQVEWPVFTGCVYQGQWQPMHADIYSHQLSSSLEEQLFVAEQVSSDDDSKKFLILLSFNFS